MPGAAAGGAGPDALARKRAGDEAARAVDDGDAVAGGAECFDRKCAWRAAQPAFPNAFNPVCARPRISAWMSCVPS